MSSINCGLRVTNLTTPPCFCCVGWKSRTDCRGFILPSPLWDLNQRPVTHWSIRILHKRASTVSWTTKKGNQTLNWQKLMPVSRRISLPVVFTVALREKFSSLVYRSMICWMLLSLNRDSTLTPGRTAAELSSTLKLWPDEGEETSSETAARLCSKCARGGDSSEGRERRQRKRTDSGYKS